MLTTSKHVRTELGVFLRTKRKQLCLSDYAVPCTTQRRTAGLRREEVAELAQVGPTWYTWLEQGRDIRASARVLRNIAAVLRLSQAETQHMMCLAGYTASNAVDAEKSGSISWFKDVVAALKSPAFMRNARYDVLVWNESFEEIFGFRADDQVIERNFLWRLFTNRWRGIALVEWEVLARHLVADFRSTYAYLGDSPAFRSLVRDLRVASPVFAEWWAQYPIDPLRTVRQSVLHPHAGELHFWIGHFDVTGHTGVKLVVAAPERASETERRLADLMSRRAGAEPPPA